MCGIFGVISPQPVLRAELERLAHHAEQRGKDSSGLYFPQGNTYALYRAAHSGAVALREGSHQVVVRVVEYGAGIRGVKQAVGDGAGAQPQGVYQLKQQG